MIRLSLPIRAVNELNGSHGHWSTVAKRRKAQRTRTAWALRHWQSGFIGLMSKIFPLTVCLTRVSPGLLDTDALPASMKAVRDEIAKQLGITDGPTDVRATWEYAQRKGKRGEYAVEIEIGRVGHVEWGARK